MRLLLLVVLVACSSKAKVDEAPGLLWQTMRVSGPEQTTIWGWSRARGPWVERRATRPGEWEAPPLRPQVQRLFARPLVVPDLSLDERAAATIVGMGFRPVFDVAVLGGP